MALFPKIFSNSRTKDTKADALHCRHESLSPMWENIEDMGEVDKISRYRCLGCGVFLSIDAAPRDATCTQATAAARSDVTSAAA
ncbi:MAG: hypothetical protein AB7R89_26665 [Dehalococcoidia bacterium]